MPSLRASLRLPQELRAIAVERFCHKLLLHPQSKWVLRVAGLREPPPGTLLLVCKAGGSKNPGCAQKPSQAGKETGQGAVRSSQTLPPRISCLLRLLGGLANLLRSRLKLEGLSYSCQGKTSTELSPSCVRGSRHGNPPPKFTPGRRLWRYLREQRFLLTG